MLIKRYSLIWILRIFVQHTHTHTVKRTPKNPKKSCGYARKTSPYKHDYSFDKIHRHRVGAVLYADKTDLYSLCVYPKKTTETPLENPARRSTFSILSTFTKKHTNNLLTN